MAGLFAFLRQWAYVRFEVAAGEVHMPINRAIDRTGGVFTPEDLALLHRVFANSSKPADTNEERDWRAARIVANFQAGIKDEQELLSRSREPL